MMDTKDRDQQRRQLLSWLAASPLFALSAQDLFAQDIKDPKELIRNFTKRPDPTVWAPNYPMDLISSPK
jgi:(S)-2-hydroxy-acid oxidase